MLAATMLTYTPVQEAEVTTEFTDFNNDGDSELAIGIPDENTGSILDACAVNIIYGSSSGLAAADNQVFQQNTSSVEDSIEVGDEFGSALASG
jgi:hypothetical protein